MEKYSIPDHLWDRMEPLLPPMKRRAGAVGRPPSSYRRIMDAIFWVLGTGAQWSALPKEFPPKSTVYDRFQYLVNEGFFTRLLENLGDELVKSWGISLDECFIDGTFVGAKRGFRDRQNQAGQGLEDRSYC